MVYDNEVKFWQTRNNPNNYSTGWSIFMSAPFKWWAYEVIWTLGWSGLAVLNIIFKLAGLDNLFNGIAAFSMIGPIGSIISLIYAKNSYSFATILERSDPGWWLAIVSTLVAS